VLYQWIDAMRCAKLPIPPSLAIAKAQKIASSMNYNHDKFQSVMAMAQEL
jgi:hypothetical protein